MNINGESRVVGIIGNPVAHTLSPAMHNAAFAKLDINFVYVPFLVHDVESALSGIRALGIRGVSVTIPFKNDVIPYLDELDEIAEAVGTVNTIINDNGKLIGTNSDGLGALLALKEVTPIAGKRIVILGNGGSAQAIAATLLLSEHAESLSVAGRSEEKLNAFHARLLKRTGKRFDTIVFQSPHFSRTIEQSDIIINTTPIGMHPNEGETPLRAALIQKHHTVFDIVYRPKETRLIADANACGATVVYGYRMLLFQAVVQFEKWTNRTAPVEVMDAALRAHLDAEGE